VTFITLKGPQVVLLSIFNDALLFTQKTGKNMNFVGLLALKNTKIAKADQMSSTFLASTKILVVFSYSSCYS
jgi:hypothetical protein